MSSTPRSTSTFKQLAGHFTVCTLSDDAAAHLLVVLEVAEHVRAGHEAEQPPVVVDDMQPSRVAL
jgi:hypothetical protein